MKLETGKYYRTRDGRKVGPLLPWGDTGYHWDGSEDSCGPDGKMIMKEDDNDDLIAEWTDTPSPVRTVTTTRQEIIPGVYGRTEIVERKTGKQVWVQHMRTASELRVAIATLTAIADAMQANTTA